MFTSERMQESIQNKCSTRVILIAVVVSLLVILGVSVGPLITRKHGMPKPFFEDNTSNIKDFYTGDLTQLSLNVMQHEVSLTFYYAHWDLDSIRFKTGYKTVASHFKDQGIFFSAINCWWSQGECSQVMRIKRYPILIAHVRGVSFDIEYRGPLVASYLIKFVENLLDPLVPITSPGDLLLLRVKHDAVVLRFVDFTRSPSSSNFNYATLLEGSVKTLVQDPFRRIAFAVVTNRKVAHKLRVLRTSSIYLFLWNQTHELSLGSDLSETSDPLQERHQRRRHVTPTPSPLFPDNAMNWIFESVHNKGSLVDWMTPTGIKSNLLTSLTSKSPTVILFTPRSLLLSTTPYFDVMKEVAMDYFNCEKANFVRSLTHRSILRRLVLQEKLLNLEDTCHEHELLDLKAVKPLNNDSCCSYKIIDFEPRDRIGVTKKCSCQICIQTDLKKYPSSGNPFNCQASAHKHLITFSPEFGLNDDSQSLSYCSDIRQSFQPRYTPFYHVDVACISAGIETTSHLPDPGDEEEDQGNHNDFILEASSSSCSKLSLALNYSDFTFPESLEVSKVSHDNQERRNSFTGLGCHSNKSLNFIAIDSVLLPSLAHSVGIDIEEEVHRTAVVILDQKQESVYLLQKSDPGNTITKTDIYDFIFKYEQNNLTRFLRTEKGSISASEQCLTMKSQLKNIVCIPELTSSLFLSLVSKDVQTSGRVDDFMVFYYTPWCGFCSSVSHVFLSVAKFFSGVKGISFARLNDDGNDLPVAYQVDRYPSILFFPSKR